MSNTTTSPNMGMPVPVVGTDPGPDWATNLNACLSVVDNHNHSAGQGAQIPLSALTGLAAASFAPSITWSHVSGGTVTINQSGLTAYYLELSPIVVCFIYQQFSVTGYSASSVYSFTATCPVTTTTISPSGTAFVSSPSSQTLISNLGAYFTNVGVIGQANATFTANGSGFLTMTFAYGIN